MGAALVLLLVGLGAMAAGVLIGRYYVPDDRQLRRTAKHARAYMRAVSHLIARDHDTVVEELRGIVEENVDDVEPYFALGALFRSRGEFERAIRVHQALALRERDRRKMKQRALYELGLDFRAAGMPRRATKAMEEVLLEEPAHEGALRALAALYEEQARFNDAAGLWQRLGKRRGEDTSDREHHLLVAAAQAALGRSDLDSAKQLLKAAQKHGETAHFFAAAAELAAARGNHRGARERLKQALIADPALAPLLLPGLIAAEEGPNHDTSRDDLDDRSDPNITNIDPQAPDTIAPAGSDPKITSSVALVALPDTIALVPSDRPAPTVTERVLEALAEIERKTGPRLELALIRAQLSPSAARGGDANAVDAKLLATQLVERYPDALAARVATAQLALETRDAAEIERSLKSLVAHLAWSLRGRWQCSNCGNRPGAFGWRCAQCRRWASLRMETGIEPPPVPSRERRAAPRTALLGDAADAALPAPSLDSGLTDTELAAAGARRSLLGRVGGWFRRKP